MVLFSADEARESPKPRGRARADGFRPLAVLDLPRL